MIRIFTFLLSIYMAFLSFCGQHRMTTAPCAPDALRFSQPLCSGADPWFYRQDGRYYYCYSLGNGVGVKTADSLAGLSSAEGKRVYTAPQNTAYACNYWAPELHKIDGRWYIYVAADDGDNKNHRMYVLSCDTPTGEFRLEGKIADPADRWAIDGTVLQLDGTLWFIWSGWEGDEDGEQSLYIAPMDSPTHVCGTRTRICSPEKAWEQNGMPINEGPEILKKNGAVYLVYSASGSWTDDYCLGMLRLCGKDPSKKENWSKCPVPVFKKTETAYGPGHCSFVVSEDGKTDYIVYHANLESGTGWAGRSIRIQPFYWVGRIPVFGNPVQVSSDEKL